MYIEKFKKAINKKESDIFCDWIVCIECPFHDNNDSSCLLSPDISFNKKTYKKQEKLLLSFKSDEDIKAYVFQRKLEKV